MAQPGLEIVRQAQGRVAGGGDDQGRPPGPAEPGRQQQRVGGADQAGDDGGMPGIGHDPLEGGRHRRDAPREDLFRDEPAQEAVQNVCRSLSKGVIARSLSTMRGSTAAT